MIPAAPAACRKYLLLACLAVSPLALPAAATPDPAVLRVQGNVTTIELAPVLLAAQAHLTYTIYLPTSY